MFDDDELVDTQVDLAAVQADDALLDVIGDRGSIPGDTDSKLIQLLLSRRSSIESEPIPLLVDVDDAFVIVNSGKVI